MKKILLYCLLISAVVACKNKTKTANISPDKPQDSLVLPPLSDSIIAQAVIYEANIRQYSPEGSFAAFTKDIPHLKELGVDILWVMPIYPISKLKRKGPDGKFASTIKDSVQRSKVLGSYYAVSDFTAVNPEFGSLQDFKKLVKTAHKNGIYVILDWVPNHTGWDHKWITKHPEYYTHNAAGEITDPLNDATGKSMGWTDVADLNYDNQEMRQKMIAAMSYWVSEQNIDGFRCDMASMVPTDFWETAIPKLRTIKPIFMLAESDATDILEDNLFDMGYGWKNFHMSNALAQGKKNGLDWIALQQKIDSIYAEDDILMNFTSNHDENSWAGTVTERLGDAAETFTALSYMLPGMPLIYSGQEYDLNKRLAFFMKDTIPHHIGQFYDVYQKLGQLKRENSALASGKQPASFAFIDNTTPQKLISFERAKAGHSIVFIANITSQPLETAVSAEGNFKRYMQGQPVELKKGQQLQLDPWEYMILVRE